MVCRRHPFGKSQTICDEIRFSTSRVFDRLEFTPRKRGRNDDQKANSNTTLISELILFSLHYDPMVHVSETREIIPMPVKLMPFVLALLFLASLDRSPAQCESELRVRYDTSRCDYCRMIFQERGFGGEIRTAVDSVLIFDATECLVAFLISEKIPVSSVKKVCSVNRRTTRSLIDAKVACYLRSDKLLSPMSVGLAAFRSKQDADSARKLLGGEVLTWKEVINLIRVRWYRKEPIK